MNDDLRALLESLDPLTRDAVRSVQIHDQADRDAVSSQLLRYRDGQGDDWADIIPSCSVHSFGGLVDGSPSCTRGRRRSWARR